MLLSRLTPASIRASQAELPPIGTVITELRRHDLHIQQEQHRYRSLRGSKSCPNNLTYAALIEGGLEVMDEPNDPIGFWAAITCRWARIVEAPPRFPAPELAEAFCRTPSPRLDADFPQVLPCFRLLLPKGTLFSEEGPEIRSVVVAEVRALEGWLPENFQTAGGGLSCVGLGEDGSTYLASNLLDPAGTWSQGLWRSGRPGLWPQRERRAAPGVAGEGLPAAASTRHRRQQGRLATGVLARPLAAHRTGGSTAGVGGAGARGVRGGYLESREWGRFLCSGLSSCSE